VIVSLRSPIKQKNHILINSGRISFAQQVKELMQYRGLLRSLAQRDFKVRYAQTFLGSLWALAQPLLSVTVLYLVFQKALSADTAGIQFMSYTLSGLLFWGFFNYNLSQGSSALIQSRNMLQKIYFPRILLVWSKSLVAFVDLLFVLLLLILVAFVEVTLTPFTGVAFLLALIFTFLASQGLALWLAALSIRYRDLQQMVPFLSQMLFFLSPIAYAPSLWSNSISPENLIWLYLNPMLGILETWRWGLFGIEPLLGVQTLLITGLYCSLLFSSGWFYFQRVERKMADLL
jgi:lipopolysaccharide transport system permease protein